MRNKLWLLEGLSSQRDIIIGINNFAKILQTDITIFASHRNTRHEILSVADYSLIEPESEEQRLDFIISTAAKWNISVIHAPRNSQWYEIHRSQIESAGITLISGAMGAQWLALADDKVAFAEFMQQKALPVVPSIRITTLDELKQHLSASPFADQPLCVKPVTGIYGTGFWRFDDSVAPMAVFNHPEQRRVHPQLYIDALSATPAFTPLVLMPYLPGPEYSVDILADKGSVLAAVARRKENGLQYLENSGEALELACACATAMQADGLVNVQTRNDSSGNPVLLEINMRPSGGIGYTQHSGVNLPGLFAFHQLGLMTNQEVINSARQAFMPATVRSITDVIRYTDCLSNRLN